MMATEQTTPHPDSWLDYTERPAMAGKTLGVLAHTFVQPGTEQKTRDIFKTIIDVAIEEPTCRVLDGNWSTIDPSHNMVYEEFADYAEFFTVQLDRPYRKAFLRWLLPIIAKPISPEFCELIMGTGDIETGEAGGAATLVQSLRFPNEVTDKLLGEIGDHAGENAAGPDCQAVRVMRSLNNPRHILSVERWTTRDAVSASLDEPGRKAFSDRMTAHSATPSFEVFDVYYNPGRFVLPT